jgi:DNA-binding transcriptional LysR family regulator
MLDRFASMTAFVATADAGSFAAAATKLRMSPQMAAKHVMFLEDRLGARLLNRTTRRQSLTELGRRYYDQCKVVLAELATADSLASEAKAAPRGRLRVTAPVTFGSYRLTPMVTRFLRDHPQVEIDLALTDRRVDLVEEGFEVAFRIGRLTASNLMARALAPYRLIACAAPSYLERRGAPVVPEELAAHECLGWSRPAGDEWVFARNGEIHRVRVRGRLQTNHGGSLLAAALEGYGVALGPEDLFRDSLAAGRLKQIVPDFAGPLRPLHLMFVSDRRQTPKIASFIPASVKEFGDGQENESVFR